MIDIAIIGAGPYGLAIAAYLKARGLEFRIFGSAMRTWVSNMPKGMRLKSEGFASSLYEPGSTYTLGHYCKERCIPYADIGLPVRLETFSAYGLEFQKRFVPELEDKQVVSLRRSEGVFRISLSDGEVLTARRVVAAIGLTHYEYVPPLLLELPQELVTHSSRHSTLEQFYGREVAVIGAGASAVDIAALLQAAGAFTHLVARKPAIRFHDPPQRIPPPLWERIRYPVTGIGPGWKLYFCANAPMVFRRLPERFRLDAVRRILGPAPGWFMKDQIVGKVPFHVDVMVTHASVRKGRVNLELTNSAGARKVLIADHVIAATGYKVDLRRLTFLSPELAAEIRSVEDTPVLSPYFESSVPGLYFVGASAANTFGPLLRFAFGAGFTAPRISKHLAKLTLHHACRHVSAAA